MKNTANHDHSFCKVFGFITISVITALLPGGTVLASDFQYDYLEIGRTQSNIGRVDGDGIDIDTRFRVGRILFLNAGYSSDTYGHPGLSSSRNSEIEFDINDLSFGINSSTVLSNTVDFVYGVEMIRREVDIKQSCCQQSETDIGFSGTIEFRLQPFPDVELRLASNPYILDNVHDIRYEIGLVYQFEHIGLFIDYEKEPLIKQTTAGIRFLF